MIFYELDSINVVTDYKHAVIRSSLQLSFYRYKNLEFFIHWKVNQGKYAGNIRQMELLWPGCPQQLYCIIALIFIVNTCPYFCEVSMYVCNLQHKCSSNYNEDFVLQLEKELVQARLSEAESQCALKEMQDKVLDIEKVRTALILSFPNQKGRVMDIR